MFARRHLDFLAEPFDISSRLVDAVFGVARALVDEGVTRLTERASFLELQPAPGAMRFARRPAQIVIQAGFAAKLLPPKSASDKAKATIAHVASAFANSL